MSQKQNCQNQTPIVYNPYAAINPAHLSDASLCWNKNNVAACSGFTPNCMIQQYSSDVFPGPIGGNRSRSITAAGSTPGR